MKPLSLLLNRNWFCTWLNCSRKSKINWKHGFYLYIFIYSAWLKEIHQCSNLLYGGILRCFYIIEPHSPTKHKCCYLRLDFSEIAVLPRLVHDELSVGVWTRSPSRLNRTRPVPTNNHCCHSGGRGGSGHSGLFLVSCNALEKDR